MAGAWSVSASASDRFDQKLPADKRAVHALNRLTFGARTADLADVKRLGVEKWIDLQLHPDRIPENPELTARLKALATLQLPTTPPALPTAIARTSRRRTRWNREPPAAPPKTGGSIAHSRR